MIGLLAPWLLAGTLLGGLPLVIHWLTRARVIPRRFPALAFLLHADAGRARRHRWRDVLILTLRTVAVLAAALAAAGLVWSGAAASGQGRPVAIVVDASASMGQVVAGATAWSRARATAGRMLAQVAGRPATVVVSGLPQRDGGAVATDHGALRTLLAEAELGAGDGDPAGALATAARLLGGPGDLLYITDLSRSALAGVDPSGLPAGVHLELVDAGGGGGNCAITGLSAEPGVVLAGRPVTVSARVANFSAVNQELRVQIRVGAAAHVVPVTLSPGGIGTATMTLTPESSGPHVVSAELAGATGDGLAVDDQRQGVLEVLPALVAVVVGDGDREDPNGPLRPLLAACAAAGLTPHASDSAGLAAELAAGSGPALVITCALADGAVVAPSLDRLLVAGGAWLQVIHSEADAALFEVGGRPTPVRLAARVDVSEQEAGRMLLGQARLEHPLLADLAGQPAVLAALAAYRYRLTPNGQAADAQVLATWKDGSIALAERPAGAGRWLVLNASPAAADTTLAQGEILPLLMHRVPDALFPARSGDLARDVGAWLPGTWSLANGSALAVLDGRVRLEAPGVFRALGGKLAAAAVPALESDLRPIDPGILGLSSRSADGATRLVERRPLWPWLLALAACCLLVEGLLVPRLGRGSR